jgi:RNA recognition motif-containing protein
MTYRIHVGHLPWRLSDEQLRSLLSQSGTPASNRIQVDRAAASARTTARQRLTVVGAPRSALDRLRDVFFAP